MTTSKTAHTITPMRTSGTEHIIERTYRESGAFQWAREVFINALEAKATRVEFGIEWQAVESKGVFRRTIADNGRGMTATELEEFFNTFGGGGKPIGGIHENFGVGSKTSLLPWNHEGMVVISWVDGEASMIWVQQDPKTGQYGLRVFESVDPSTGQIVKTEVVSPFPDSESGCDWAKIKASWIGDHGTVIVLLGNDLSDHTVLGDPNRKESDIKGLSSYLNRRVWEIPEDVDVFVHELRFTEQNKWPSTRKIAFGPQPKMGEDKRINNRRIRGAEYYIGYPVSNHTSGSLKASGTVPLSDGTEIDWYLWNGDRPKVHSYASIGGYIAALYKNELYDITSHHSTYRSFGVSESAVRKDLWLIARPPVFDDRSKIGVYPRGDRNALLIKGGPDAGSSLPLNDWAGQFADSMPDEIREAIRAARGGASGSVTDDQWRQRLADRFGSRWKIDRLRAHQTGAQSMTATQAGSTPRPVIQAAPTTTRSSGGSGGTSGATNTGSGAGLTPAKKMKVAGGIPRYRIVDADDVGDGMIAAWQPHDPEFPEGVVLINGSHPMIEKEIEYWQDQYADHHADEVRKVVHEVYGEVAVAKVAHSEFMKAHIAASVVESELRSPYALTMALLGLIGEEAVIIPRLRGKLGKRRAA